MISYRDKINYLAAIKLMFVFFIVFSNSHIQTVKAENECGTETPYSVEKISSNGDHSKIGCFATYEEADSEMLKHESNIDSTPVIILDGITINAKHGILQFDSVGGADVIDVYNSNNGKIKHTYISSTGSYGGDAALISTEGNMLKNRLAGYNGWIYSDRANIIPLSLAKHTSYYLVNSEGELVHHISKNPASDGLTHGLVIDAAPDFLKEGIKYYSYDGNYFYTSIISMLDDYKDDSFGASINEDNPYFNYYQFLPYHTKTKASSEDIDHYLSDVKGYESKPKTNNGLTGNQSMLFNEGSSFITSQDYFGTNALLTYNIAINESGWGRSKLSIERNNLFGHAAYDGNETAAITYDNIIESIDSHNNKYMSWGYLYAEDFRYYGGHLGNKSSGVNVKYASDPYWGEKAASHYYNIDKTLGLDEKENYKLGIKTNKSFINVRKEPNTDASVLFQLVNDTNVPVVILGTVIGDKVDGSNIWYKIQTDSYLDSDRNLMLKGGKDDRVEYDFSNNYGYVHSSLIYTEDFEEKEAEGNFYFNSLTYNKDTDMIDFSGYLTINGINNVANKEIVYELILTNEDGKKFVYGMDRDYDPPFEIPMGDGYDYSMSWFSQSLDLSGLPQGNYTGDVRASSGEDYATAVLKNSFLKPMSSFATLNNGKFFEFKTNYYKKNIPIEIFVRDSGSIANKTMDSYNNMINNFSIIELSDGKMYVKGFSYNVDVDYSEKASVSRRLILENNSTYETKYFDLDTLDAGDYLVTLRVDDNKSKQRAWYDGSIDISSLGIGEYSIYIETNTKEGSDYSELNDIFVKELPGPTTTNDLSISFLNNEAKRNRIELKID